MIASILTLIWKSLLDCLIILVFFLALDKIDLLFDFNLSVLFYKFKNQDLFHKFITERTHSRTHSHLYID